MRKEGNCQDSVYLQPSRQAETGILVIDVEVGRIFLPDSKSYIRTRPTRTTMLDSNSRTNVSL